MFFQIHDLLFLSSRPAFIELVTLVVAVITLGSASPHSLPLAWDSASDLTIPIRQQ